MNWRHGYVIICDPRKQPEAPSLDSMIFSWVLAILLLSSTHCQAHARDDRGGYEIPNKHPSAAARRTNHDVFGLYTKGIHLPGHIEAAKSEVDHGESYGETETEHNHINRLWLDSSNPKISRRTNKKISLGKTGKFLADVARRIPMPRHGRIMKNDARVRKALSDRPLPKGHYGKDV